MQKILTKDWFLLALISILTIIIKSFNLKYFTHDWDEGVYLYASKAIFDGLSAYKDFALAHPPFLSYFYSLILGLTDSYIITRIVHLLISTASIFVIFAILKKFKVNKYIIWLAVLSYFALPIFHSYSKVVMMEPMTGLLLMTSIYFLIINQSKYRHFIIGFLLGLAFMTKYTTVLFGFSFGLFYLYNIFLVKDKSAIKDTIYLILGFLVITVPTIICFGQDQSFWNNTIFFQLGRDKSTKNMSQLFIFIITNAHIFILGLIGCLYNGYRFRKEHIFFMIFNTINWFSLLFLFNSSYSYYFIHITGPLLISAGYFSSYLYTKLNIKWVKPISISGLILFVYLTFQFISNVYTYDTYYPYKNRYEQISKHMDKSDVMYTDNTIFYFMLHKKPIQWYYAADAYLARHRNLTVIQYKPILEADTLLIFHPHWITNEEIRNKINEKYSLVLTGEMNEKNFYVYKIK